jgi:hypothetical protein
MDFDFPEELAEQCNIVTAGLTALTRPHKNLITNPAAFLKDPNLSGSAHLGV